MLSDGKISDKGKGRELLDMFYDTQYNSLEKQEENQKNLDKTEEVVTDPKIGIWQATRLKKLIKTKQTVLEIARLTYTDFAEILRVVFNDQAFYKPTNYNQTLIIISGNLDEAYVNASSVGEVEIDADIFHSTTAKINILNIKESLAKRFRPEQISRFGNIHLIYRSLNKTHYHELISLKIKDICTQIKEKLNISVSVNYNLNELIYNNGVFPAQGVRPVFSTITEILECNLSKYLFEAVDGGYNKISVNYNFKESNIEATLSTDIKSKSKNKAETKFIATPFIGRIDKIKLIENTNNLKALTAVHESGHALLYILNFGLAPIQLKSNIASTASYGFTFSHKIHLTKSFILKKIQVYLAGHLAEKVIFGDDKTSVGHTTDWKEATTLASDYIRKLGYGSVTNSVITSITSGDAEKFNTNIELSNEEIDRIIQNQIEITTNILEQNKNLLIILSKSLLQESSLVPKQIKDIMDKNRIECEIENEDFVVYEKYASLLEAL